MPLKVIAVFGSVALTLTAIKLARQGWVLFGPSKIKSLYEPALLAETEQCKRDFAALGLCVRALTKDENTPC